MQLKNREDRNSRKITIKIEEVYMTKIVKILYQSGLKDDSNFSINPKNRNQEDLSDVFLNLQLTQSEL